jgi:hypothetical protein
MKKDMELEIISAKKFSVKLKCALHSSGKLGFTDETSKTLGFETGMGVKFAQDKEGELYLINNKKMDEDSFKLCKAGSYYYIRAMQLFDSLGYDYRKENIIFDMIKVEGENEEIYKLNKRSKPRKTKDEK